MKVAVIYNSQTGFTKKYAEWISEATGADCLELKVAKKQDFDRYDAIVFGGWACAGRISKISWFKSNMDKWSDKTLIAFCTGGNPAENPEIETFLNNNFSEAERRIRSARSHPDIKTRHQTLCKASAYLVSAGTGRNLARQGYLKRRPEAGRCNHDASCREKYTIILQ